MLDQDIIERARNSAIWDVISARHITLVRKGRSFEFEGPCPKCGGRDRFSVNVADRVWNCRGCKGDATGDVIGLVQWLDGCSFSEAVEKLAGKIAHKPNGNGHDIMGPEPPEHGWSRLSARKQFCERPIRRAYEYYTPEGKHAYDKVRFDDTDDGDKCAWRRPDGKGGYIWGLGDAPKLLYNFHDLISGLAQGLRVAITEGERDCDTLRNAGITATSGLGSGIWQEDFNQYFLGHDVILCGDNDEAGRKYVAELKARIEPICNVAVFDLKTAWPQCPYKGDITDWFEIGGGTAEKFWEEINGRKSSLSAKEWIDRDIQMMDAILGEVFTKTTRAILIAPTGHGKTNFSMQIALQMAAGVEFLHWKCSKQWKVLYVDGEMPRRLVKKRITDGCNRLGFIPDNFYCLSHEDIDNFYPLNTKEGQKCIESEIEKIGGIDFIFFDSVMCLIPGDMKEEDAWRDTLPWIKSITKRNIGQLWVHHTGHDESRGYGTKTREWQMDVVMVLEPVQRSGSDVSFALKYSKARERTPDNRNDFNAINVWLNDKWEWSIIDNDMKKKPSPIGSKFFDALKSAIDKNWINGKDTISMKEWKEECFARGLIDRDKDNSARSLMSKYRLELIAANMIVCNEDDVWIA